MERVKGPMNASLLLQEEEGNVEHGPARTVINGERS